MSVHMCVCVCVYVSACVRAYVKICVFLFEIYVLSIDISIAAHNQT